jgi:hypothetical protein
MFFSKSKQPEPVDEEKIKKGRELRELKAQPGWDHVKKRIADSLQHNQDKIGALARHGSKPGEFEFYAFRSAALSELVEWIEAEIEAGANELLYKLSLDKPISRQSEKDPQE